MEPGPILSLAEKKTVVKSAAKIVVKPAAKRMVKKSVVKKVAAPVKRARVSSAKPTLAKRKKKA